MSINPTGQQPNKLLYLLKVPPSPQLTQEETRDIKIQCLNINNRLQTQNPGNPDRTAVVSYSRTKGEIGILDCPENSQYGFIMSQIKRLCPALGFLEHWNSLIGTRAREVPHCFGFVYRSNPQPEPGVVREGEEERVAPPVPAPLELRRAQALPEAPQEEETKAPDLAASREEEAHVAAPAPAPLNPRRTQSVPEAVQCKEEEARVAANPFPAPLNPRRTQSLPERTQEQAVSLDSPFKRIRKVPGKLDQQG